MKTLLQLAAAVAAGVAIGACNNSSSPSNGSVTSNTLAFTIDAGPANNYFNGAFTSVTVCSPGSSTSCQTISGVLIDTGSSGLRLLKSALTVQLRQENTAAGNPIVECSQFLDGITWGPVQVADVKLGSESAASVPIQVIDESQFPTIPSACTSAGSPEDTLTALGANGILGIGLFRQDCGPACSLTGANNPGLYYECTSASSCAVAPVSTSAQLQNPVWMFSRDNNGVVITIPQVASPGLVSVSGTLLFGIGTQSNNGLGSAHVLTTDASGNISTVFRNQTYSSFIDAGSNGYYFLDSATTGLTACADNKDFYCPSSPQTLTATNRGANGVSNTVTWMIENADAIPAPLNVLPTIGGTNAGSFDWGLPFFFGKTVFTGIEGQSSPGGTGPYFAY